MEYTEWRGERTYELRRRETKDAYLPERSCWDLFVRDRDGEIRLEDVASEEQTARRILRVFSENGVGSFEAPYVIEDLLSDAEYLD